MCKRCDELDAALTTAQQTIEELSDQIEVLEAANERTINVETALADAESQIEELTRERDEALAALFRSQQATANACMDSEKLESLITQTVKWCEELAEIVDTSTEMRIYRSCAAKLKGERERSEGEAA